MEITLNQGSLYENVARSLSIIGKRASDNNGNKLFSSIVLSSAEKPIICDYFANAFTELCASLGRFITAETRHVDTFSGYAQVSFWTDQEPATLAGDITSNSQLLYQYTTRKLYEASLSFSFAPHTTSSTDVFKYGDNYYDHQLTLIAEPTDAQKDAAISLVGLGTDPQTLVVKTPGLLAGYDGMVYESQRQALFTETAPSATTIYYAPSGVAYRWLYEAMQATPAGMSDELELAVSVPDNWNSALTMSFRQALYNYCIAYALYSWFTVTAPHIAEKYLQDTQRQAAAILEIIHEKRPPKSAADFANPTGTVS